MTATPFTARLASVIVLVVLAASALTISLNYFKFRRVLRSQEDLVYAFVADDLVQTIEDSMNIGIALPMLQTTEQVIERRRAAEAGVVGIVVFDSNGAVLFDTDRFRISTKMPAEWLPPAGVNGDWRADLVGVNLVGANLINSFDQRAGGVAVLYDTAPLEARSRAILLDMMRVGLVAVAATAIVAVLATTVLTWRLRVWFARATRQVAVLSAGTAEPRVEGSDALMDSIETTVRVLDDAERRLMALGAGEAGQQPRAA